MSVRLHLLYSKPWNEIQNLGTKFIISIKKSPGDSSLRLTGRVYCIIYYVYLIEHSETCIREQPVYGAGYHLQGENQGYSFVSLPEHGRIGNTVHQKS